MHSNRGNDELTEFLRGAASDETQDVSAREAARLGAFEDEAAEEGDSDGQA